MTRAPRRSSRKSAPQAAAPGSGESLGFLLTDVVRLMRTDFTSRTRDIPLTPALHRLLFFVNRLPGCRQVELANWLDVTPVTVGRMIDRLEKNNLVRRESQPGDRRVSRVHIAAGAAKLLEQLNARAPATRERALHGMSERECVALLGALQHLRDNLQSESPDAATSRPKSRVR